MSSILEEFDEEQESDSEEVKRRRFDRILDVMQQMQELGQPPKDIVGELVSSFYIFLNSFYLFILCQFSILFFEPPYNHHHYLKRLFLPC